jgi:hypothetical protein
MNLKHMTIGCVVLAASAAMSLPAHAAKLTNGSTLNLANNINGGAIKIDPFNGTDLKFDFFGARTPGITPALNNQGIRTVSATGSFPGTNNNPITQIKDLVLTGLINPDKFVGSPVTNFLAGIDVAGNSNLTFDLSSFRYNKSTGIGKFAGVFSDGVKGLGVFTLGAPIVTPNTGTDDFRYTLSVTAVPTPALLPGLLGLGVAALRKRKGEGSEVEETVGVKA